MAVTINKQEVPVVGDTINLDDVSTREFVREEVRQQNLEIISIRNKRDVLVLERDAFVARLAELNAEITALNTQITAVRDARDGNVAYLQGKGDEIE